MDFDLKIPKVSVILPVYNAAKYLHDAIESILKQTFTDFEFLLINDGSIDESENIILSYSDDRIRYIKNEKNLGLAETLNKGIELSRGIYIARMDADDYSYPTRFEKQVKFLDSHYDYGVCATLFKIFLNDEFVKIANHAESFEEIKISLLGQCEVGHPTVMMRKSSIKNIRYKAEYNPADDYEFWTRLSRITKIYNIQEALLDYRFHNSNMSVIDNSDQRTNSKKIIGNQIEYLGLENNEINIAFCEMLFTSFLKRLNFSEFISLTLFANKLEEENRRILFYDNKILNKRISDKLIQYYINLKNGRIAILPFILKNRNGIINLKRGMFIFKSMVKIIFRRIKNKNN